VSGIEGAELKDWLARFHLPEVMPARDDDGRVQDATGRHAFGEWEASLTPMARVFPGFAQHDPRPRLAIFPPLPVFRTQGGLGSISQAQVDQFEAGFEQSLARIENVMGGYPASRVTVATVQV